MKDGKKWNGYYKKSENNIKTRSNYYKEQEDEPQINHENENFKEKKNVTTCFSTHITSYKLNRKKKNFWSLCY